jgi:hypothetical protein
LKDEHGEDAMLRAYFVQVTVRVSEL